MQGLVKVVHPYFLNQHSHHVIKFSTLCLQYDVVHFLSRKICVFGCMKLSNHLLYTELPVKRMSVCAALGEGFIAGITLYVPQFCTQDCYACPKKKAYRCLCILYSWTVFLVFIFIYLRIGFYFSA